MNSQKSGFIVIDKPAGVTSARAIAQVQKKLGLKKVGHAGTLDPFATGLLVVLVNRATKLASLVGGGIKCYHATFRFGIATDTDDRTGSVIQVSSHIPTLQEVNLALAQFVGTIQQSPPRYSAVKISGKRAYARARADEKFETTAKKVFIEKIEILTYQPPDLSLVIHCGSGTYIRSIARDLGSVLKSAATVTALRRTLSSPFSIEQSNTDNPSILSWDLVCSHCPRVPVSPAQAQGLKGGDERIVRQLSLTLLPKRAEKGDWIVFENQLNSASLGVLEYSGIDWKLWAYLGNSMPSLVVVGAQWGDEGKGKLVDYLTSRAAFVARFQGGNNAGHTLVVDGIKTKLSVVPSGILRSECTCLIGAGVVVNPDVLLQELTDLRKAGVVIAADRLIIDRDAHLILECHGQVDRAREKRKGENKIGTTGRGIGPAYEDRASRIGIRVGELLHFDALLAHLAEVCEEKNRYLQYVLESEERVDFAAEKARLERAARELGPHIGNVSLILDRAIKEDAKIVFEGAQGTLLDQAHGTVPFVTSSHTIAGGVTIGCGVGPKCINYVLGVAKAYTTRVGSGPFPTEISGGVGDVIRERGAEFGTVTGRPRRCGWLDAFSLKRAVRLNGFDGLVVTKLDVLSGIEKLKICISYTLDGRKLDDVPSQAADLERIEPQYIELRGWSEDLSKIEKWHDLPSEAKLYLTAVAEIVGCPIVIASVGPERNSTLFSSTASFVKNFVG